MCALGALARNGSLVLKMFNLFECETVCLLYILALHFKELSIFKPASSRAPNAETYVVALGFRGIDQDILNSLLSFVSPTFPSGKALLSLDSIPQSFLDELIKIAEYFTIKQIQAIERNLNLEQIWNRNVQQAIFQLNQDIVDEFRKQCSIDFHYRQSDRIVKNVGLDGSAKALGNSAAVVKGRLRQRAGGTLEDRQNLKRNREEFLLSNNDNNNNNNNDSVDINDDDVEGERSAKRRNLGQGKTVVSGLDYSKKGRINDTIDEMDVESSNNEEQQQPPTESLAMKMMRKSGFIEGQGLGIHGQGRSTPIEPVMHTNRLGLGHHSQSTITSSSTSDVPKVVDEPLFSSFDQPISIDSSSSPLKLRSITIGLNLNRVLSSLFVKYEDLESLYKKRESFIEKTLHDNRKKTRIFISDQLENLNKGEQYKDGDGNNINHPIYMDKSSAFQLASLDKEFKLVRKISK